MLDDMISADAIRLRLKTLNPTRWRGRRVALDNFLQLFEPLIDCLERLADCGDTATSSQAGNLLGKFRKPHSEPG